MAPLMLVRSQYQEAGIGEKELTVIGDAYEIIADIAREENKSPTEVLQEAISLKRWFSKVGQDGGEVFVQKKGRVRRVSQP